MAFIVGEEVSRTSTGAGSGLGGSRGLGGSILILLGGGGVAETIGTAGRAVTGGAVGGANCSTGVFGLLYATGARGAGVSEDAVAAGDGVRGRFARDWGVSDSWVFVFREDDLAGCAPPEGLRGDIRSALRGGGATGSLLAAGLMRGGGTRSLSWGLDGSMGGLLLSGGGFSPGCANCGDGCKSWAGSGDSRISPNRP